MSETSDKAFAIAKGYKKLIDMDSVGVNHEWSEPEENIYVIKYGDDANDGWGENWFTFVFEWGDINKKYPYIKADYSYNFTDTTTNFIAEMVHDIACTLAELIQSNYSPEALFFVQADFLERDLLYIELWQRIGLPLLPEIKQIQDDLTQAKYIRDNRAGYIYLVQAISPHSYFKIGRSKDAITHIKSMGVKLPFPIEPIHIMRTNDMYIAERELHDKYAEYRAEVEWFKLAPQHIQEICKEGNYYVEVRS